MSAERTSLFDHVFRALQAHFVTRPVTTNRPRAASTAGGRTQEGSAPMRDKRNPVRTTYSRWYWFKWRVAGRFFHVEAVTEAWYAQHCPPTAQFDTSFLTLGERIRWAIDKWLRECWRWEAQHGH